MELKNLISATEPSSAKTFNKPARNVYEQLEKCYYLINNLYDTIGGNLTGNSSKCFILPGVLEEFNVDNLKIVGGNFLRIPTGAIYRKQNTLSDSSISRQQYTDKYNSTVIINAPNIEEFERLIAEKLNFDLHDRNNDILIDYYRDNDGSLKYKCDVKYYDLSASGDITEGSFEKNDINFNVGDLTKKFFDDIFGITIDNSIYNEQTLDELINIETLSPERTYYVYYNQSKIKDVFYSTSKKFFISSNQNYTDDLKLFTFKLDSEKNLVEKECLLTIKNATRWFACNSDDVTNFLNSQS